MRYAYPCDMTPDVEEGYGYVVTFPGIRGATTGAATWEESLFLAEDALIAVLGIYINRGLDIPVPSSPRDGQPLIGVSPLQSAKLDLYTEMRERGVSQSDLANALGVRESDIRDLIDLDWDSTPAQVAAAREAVKAGAKQPAAGVPA